MPPFIRRQTWNLPATPEALWPFVSNSQRMNYEWGSAPIVSRIPRGARLPNGFHHVQAGPVWFKEEPFQWVRPYYYHSVRHFFPKILFDVFDATIEIEPTATGSAVSVTMKVTPATILGRAIIPIVLAVLYSGTGRSLQHYAVEANRPRPTPFNLPPHAASFTPGGRRRLASLRAPLNTASGTPELAARLFTFLETADDMAVTHFRPYALADAWEVSRPALLTLCLHATRVGVLSFDWEILCPLCRGAQERFQTLGTLPSEVHCDSCNIDFTVNFERSVELLFSPHPAIRPSFKQQFCVGGPQLTPHIVVQQLLAPGERRALRPFVLEHGNYRLRILELPAQLPVQITPAGPPTAAITLRPDGWPIQHLALGPHTALTLENTTPDAQVFILERTAWTDQAATAADVTATQAFRDLFAREALRPQQHVSVGSLAVLFTDLRASTRLYQEVGDALAFAQVMRHFDVLRAAIVAEDGALVKTIGDAVLAVFTRPVNAVRAVLAAQATLATLPDAPTWRLKAGIHYGPCIAVTLNERLDYFGTTVNLASRLETLCGELNARVVLSDSVRHDPEVATYLATSANTTVTPITVTVRGFEDTPLDVWRVS